MDLSTPIVDFATGTYTVTRAGGAGTYVDGVFVPASTSSVSVLACVQPLTGRELERLPEGIRSRELLSVYTVAALFNEAPGVRPDIIAIDGRSWQVEKVERFDALGNYFHSIVSKIPEEDS
jgi:hypothetical protein